jgi:TPR repeat protein
MYQQGQGVPRDYQQAYFWLNLAAAHAPAEFSQSQISQETAIRIRDNAATRLTPAQLAEAQAQARTWQPKPETPNGLSR